LLAERQGEEKLLLAFPRHVYVLWSPSGERLAVTDARASDTSTVLLWSDLTAAPVDLLDALATQEGQRVAGWNAHHVYLEATRWLTDRNLLVRLWGYGDPTQQMDRQYVYTLGQGFSRH
jgi:hypothetical protein